MSTAAGLPLAGAGIRVLLCDDLAEPPAPLDPRRLAPAIRRHDDVEVVTVERVCSDPSTLRNSVAGTAGAVVVCRHGHESRDDLTAWLHRAGLRIDNVDIVCPPEASTSALLAIHAAIAAVRAEPYPMLSAERPTRLPMPATNHQNCRASTGCDLCIHRCPQQAITMTHGAPTIDPTRCTGCGACVATCPTGAWRLAGFSPRQLTARLNALLHPVGLPPPVGIEFRCMSARSPSELGHGWAEVVVPSVAALGLGVVLQTRLGGTREVSLTACDDTDCRAAAQHLGDLADAVMTASAAAVTGPGSRSVMVRDPGATLAAVTSLAGDTTVRLSDPTAPLGVVTVDSERCTGCEACVATCPTSALSVAGNGDWTLGYDARRCVGCGLCSRACPEGAMDVQRVIDTAVLGTGHIVLIRQAPQPCSTCGRPIRDAAVRRAAAARLERDSPGAAALVASTCGSCGPADIGTDLPA